MELAEKIEQMALSQLTDKAHFLVSVSVTGGAVQKKVLVVMDGDNGVTVEDCAKVSRGLAELLEEKGLISQHYTLEVTTPGLDSPLKLVRQYKKNIGRNLKVTLNDKSQMKGKLTAADETGILLDAEYKIEKKKTEIKKVEIPYEQINKALVQITFK
ncbi:MAG TPA: ribosome maturation factor RimP [Cyclobacteriaceae bacterium]|nr:ribosome maturation factor RimP [Cyclobacteriaceae bacterium]